MDETGTRLVESPLSECPGIVYDVLPYRSRDGIPAPARDPRSRSRFPAPMAATPTPAVIGLGYVGLPLLLRFARAGLPVVGIDRDPAKIAALERGECYLGHLPENRFRESLDGATTRFSEDPAAVNAATHVVICLPTPLGAHREPDLSYVLGAADVFGAHLVDGQTVILESTTFVLMEKLEARGARIAYHDPHLPAIPETREHAAYAGRSREPVSDDYDCLVLVTAHSEYRRIDFSGYRCPLVDTRNAVAPEHRPADYYRA